MAHVVLLSLLLVLATCHGSAEAIRLTAVVPPAKQASEEYLDAHNAARVDVGVAPLRWSDALANLTSRLVRYQRDKMGCQFADLTTSKYGGNQLYAGGQPVSPRAAVEKWVDEKKFYNHANNSCVPNHHCGVYTQVVWRKSMELGCSQATCAKDLTSITICYYNPPGNFVGESPY